MGCLSRAGAALFAIMLASSCSVIETTSTTTASQRTCASGASTPDCPPPAAREFRALWVATVANIDWPSKPGLSVAQQKAEATALLNRVQALNMNAVLLQVRPSADAIYPSAIEPWSEWLTGEQGRAPGYDPLAFWVTEAKARGIELHAWFNPYRARHTKAVSANAKDHVVNRLPQAVKSYGGFLWLDPGEIAAQDHSFAVIMDVVKRYDIDGVHFDDYFYPYPVTEQAATQQPSTQNAVANALNGVVNVPGVVTRTPERELDFPDEPSWRAYVASGGKLMRADWRRDNVNRFVERVYRGVKAEKPWLRFGISPFGIGRPDRRPPGIAGFSQYDKLYADVELWLERGWLDYLAPQLYCPIEQKPQAFAVLLDYWHRQNPLKRDIFPGLYTSQINDAARGWEPKEIERQIALIRAQPGVAQGHIHFSAAPLLQNRRDVNATLAKAYPTTALHTIAQSSLEESRIDQVIEIDIERGASQIQSGLKIRSFSDQTASAPRGFALYLRYGSRWQFEFLPLLSSPVAGVGGTSVAVETTIPAATADGVLSAVAASLVDRYARESARAVREVRP